MKSLTKTKQKKPTDQTNESTPERKPEEHKAPEVAQCCAKTARVVAGCHD